MRRSLAALVAVLIVCFAARTALAQTTLIGGGLTALPPVTLSPNLVLNNGFEVLSGGLPANWGTGTGWSADQLVTHSGSFSYRWTTGAPSSDQAVVLKKGIYNLSGWIKTQNVSAGNPGVRLQLDFRPGGINQWFTTDVIHGTTDWAVYAINSIVVPQDMRVAVRLENYAGASGTAWFDDIILQQQLPQPIDAFMLYPNYRGMLFDDGPSTMRFDLTVNPPGGDFSRVKVRGVLTDEATGQVVVSQDFTAAAGMTAQLDGGLMQPGRAYLASFSLVDLSTGTSVSTTPAYRVSTVAAAVRQSMNVSFDARNRVLLHGTPRFVLGAYDSGLGYTTDPAAWEQQLWSSTGDRRMNGLRINLYLNYWYGQATADSMAALMTNLQSHGVMYLQTGNCFDKFPADQTFLINSSDAYVQTIGSHPGSAGYYTIDECQSSLMPGAFTQYQRLRSLDPDSMTFAALLGDVNLPVWRDAMDVLSTDPYPLFGAEPAGGYNLAQVADWTALARSTVKDARPYFTVLQFFQFTSLGRWPTLPEMRNQAYMAIVEGAKGLFWWSLGNNALTNVCTDWCATRTQYMNNLKTLVGELADLEPALLADDAPGALIGNTSSAAIRTRVKVLNGQSYLIAYNYTNQTITPTFTWNAPPGTISVNAESRTIVASGSSFSDTFGAYQAHVYVIGTGAPPPPPPPPPPGNLGVSFVNPQSGATVTGTTTITLNATGGTSPYAYRLDVDGSNVYTGATNSFSWNTTTASPGGHTLLATVTDAAGATATASLAVTVATAGTLRAIFTSPTASSTVSGGVAANVWVENQSGTSNTFTLAVDGPTVQSQTISGVHVTFVWDSTKVADGAHTLTATVKDATGNTGTSSLSVTTSNGVTSPTVSAITPATGTLGATISSTISGTGFVSGATVNLGAGITVTNVSVVSSTQLTATLAIGSGAALGAHDVIITNPSGASATLPRGFSLTTAGGGGGGSATLTLAYNGKLRDRVGQGNLALSGDGALDGTLTATLNATGGRTVTALTLQSSAPGTWDTDGSSGYWVLAVAPTLDGALLNNSTTMAVNFSVANGGSFVVFASDSNGIEFVPGTTLTLTATFVDGSEATATTTVTPNVAGAATLTLVYNGKLRDRVGQGNLALGPDGAPDGMLTATINGGGRTVTGLTLQSSAPGTWDTDSGSGYWVLGVASTADGALLNDAATMAVNVTVADGGSFVIFASDSGGIEFAVGTTLTLTATFADGSSATGTASVVAGAPATLTVTYNGKLRDRVGQGNLALSADGALDGTLTATLTGTGARTVTGLTLQSSAPGTWDTESGSGYWILGVAPTLDGTLLNNSSTMAVNFPVADGGSVLVFASDWNGIEFLSGTTLTLTAALSDGSTVTAHTTVP